MKTVRFLFVLAITALFTAISYAQTAEEIVQKYMDAAGTKAKWDSIKTMKATGYASMGGMEFSFTQYQKRPGKALLEVIVQGMVMKQAYDGTMAWTINPFQGSKKPEKVDDETAKHFKDMGIIGGKLMNWKENECKIELIGKEDFEGTEVFKLKLTDKDAMETMYYLDAAKYLELKVTAKSKMMGKEIESETTYGNFKTVNGVMIPFTMEINTKGSQMGSQTLKLDKVEHNVDMDDAIFVMPKE